MMISDIYLGVNLSFGLQLCYCQYTGLNTWVLTLEIWIALLLPHRITPTRCFVARKLLGRLVYIRGWEGRGGVTCPKPGGVGVYLLPVCRVTRDHAPCTWHCWRRGFTLTHYRISVDPYFFLLLLFNSSVGNGDEYLELQSISVDNLWYNEIALASMTAILMFFTYIALRLIKKEK